ncbi:MAG: hypothetical protein EHM89_07330 [Acidobacteria bacterium]|nr:MAG: hypothetical protein EHM89_07330 [Acidobacteriota bacterium]
MSKRALLWLITYLTGVAFTFHEPFWGVATYLVDYYVHPPLQWWGDELPDLRWSLLPASALMISYFLHGRTLWDKNILRHPQTTWLLLFLGLAAVLTPFALDETRSLHYLSIIGKYTLLYLIFVGSIRTHRHFRYFVALMMLGSIFWGYEALDATRSAGRLEGVGGPDADSDNALSAHLLPMLPLLAVAVWKGNRWEKVLAILAAPFVLNTIILANSRGATVGILIGAMAALVLSQWRMRVRLVPLMMVGALLFWALTDTTFLERQSTLLDKDPKGASDRIELWKGGLALIDDYPLGVGGGGYDKLSPIYVPKAVKEADGQERTVHNTYLWVATDWGIQGLVAMFGLIGATIVSLHRIRRRTADQLIMLQSFALEVGFFAFLGAAFFVNRTYSEMLYWIPALTAVLANVQSRAWDQEQVPVGATAASGPQSPVMLGGHVGNAAARMREGGSGFPLAGNM